MSFVCEPALSPVVDMLAFFLFYAEFTPYENTKVQLFFISLNLKIMKTHTLTSVLFVATSLIISCNKDDYAPHPDAKIFTYDFSISQDDWIGGFSDHHPLSSADYDLLFLRTTLPAPLNTSKYALKIGGTNRSDDLFMFIKRKIKGLEPNKTYQIRFDVEFASNAPTNLVGVGGAPDAVFMKAGATLHEPVSTYIAHEDTFRMNIDHGNQSQDGADMYNIGSIGVGRNTTQYTLISRNNKSRLFPITTDANGEVWVIIGTDSGFESRTELYYNTITLTFNP